MTAPEPLIAATPVTVVGHGNANVGTIPTHRAGDLLVVLWHSNAPLTAPTPGGTVPQWKQLTNATLTNTVAANSGSSMLLSVWYAWAAGTADTLGSGWGTFGWVYVLRDVDKTNPFGSGSKRMDSANQNYPTAPGVGTMEFPGKSVVIHNLGWNHPSSLSYSQSPSASNGGMIQATNTTGVRGQYVGHQLEPTSAGNAAGLLVSPANITSGVSIEIVPLRPGPGLNVTQAGVWKRSTPKAVLQDGVWVPVKRVHAVQDGTWKEAWPNTPVEPEPEPQYMYDVTFEYLPNYEVQFHIKKGYIDTSGDENLFMTSTVNGNNANVAGYCSRDPKFTFFAAAVPFLCTFEDRSGVPGDPTSVGKKITVTVYPKP